MIPIVAPLALIDYFMVLETMINFEYRMGKLRDFSVIQTRRIRE